MSKSQLIYEYLDTGLEDTREDMLFKELYENKEYRDEFFSMVKYEGAASLSFANTQVPLSSTNAIFSNLGISLPNAEVAVVEKERPLVGIFSSVGSVAIFTHFRDYVSAFLGLLIGGLLTAFIFMFTGNNDVQTVVQQNNTGGQTTNQSNNQSSNNQSNNGFAPVNTQNLQNEGNNNTFRSSTGNSNINSQRNLTVSNINSNGNNSNFDLNQFSSLNLTEEIIKNLGILIINNEASPNDNSLKNELSSSIMNELNNSNSIIIDSTSNNLTVFNVNNYLTLNSDNINSQLNIINSLTEQTKEVLFKDNIFYVDNQVYEEAKDFNDFTLNFSGIGYAQNSYNNQTIAFSNNIRLGLLYSVASNHSLGIEVGNEQFVLPNQNAIYQLKNTYFIGANYKFDIKDLSLVKGIYPSIGTSINFATIGTIARLNLGLNLRPENRLSFGVFYEPSILFNNYRDLGTNYSKNNIIIGVSYKLE